MEDLKKKSDNDLKEMLATERGALKDFRNSMTSSKIRNVNQGRLISAKIARILTEIRNRNK